MVLGDQMPSKLPTSMRLGRSGLMRAVASLIGLYGNKTNASCGSGTRSRTRRD
jgi:hypothetical protein